MIVRLALLGGDGALEAEVRAALVDLPEIALLAAGHSADADMLLAADSALAAAGDLVRGERSRRADARILLVAPAGALSAAQQALECGAVGVVERPLDALGLRHALAAAGCFDTHPLPRALEDEGHVALLGAGGGMGTSACAVALAAAHERAFVLDLALANGDAADVAAVHVAVPDALLRIACGPVTTPAELAAGLAHGYSCSVLAAPALPEHADLIDERGIARVLDLASATGCASLSVRRAGGRSRQSRSRSLLRTPRWNRRQRGCARSPRRRRTALLIADSASPRASRVIVATSGARSPRAAHSLAARPGCRCLPTVEPGCPRAACARARPASARRRVAALAALAGDAARESLGTGAAERRRGDRTARACPDSVALRPDPLAALLNDSSITEVIVNGPAEIWVERRGRLQRAALRFDDTGALRDACVRLAARAGRRLDDAQPMVDARLADGSRLNVVLPPLAPDGPLLTLRRFAPRPFTLTELVELRLARAEPTPTCSTAACARACSIVISGGTSSGKTSPLGALAARSTRASGS